MLLCGSAARGAALRPAECVARRRPFCIQVLAHVQRAGHFVAVQLARKVIGECRAVYLAHYAGDAHFITRNRAGEITRDKIALMGSHELIPLLLHVKAVIRATGGKLDMHVPTAGEIGCRCSRSLLIARRARWPKERGNAVAHDLVLSWRNHVGCDRNARLITRASASSSPSAATQRNPRLSGEQDVGDLLACDAKPGGIPRD